MAEINSVEPIVFSYNAEPTPAQFHASNAYIKGLLGPLGSSKTSTCIMEIMHRAMTQRPHRGVRRTRFGVIRNTYPELKSTTIKTFQEWIPEQICRFKFDAPITCVVEFQLPDSTWVHCEVIFVSCDKPRDVAKLKSLNLTGVFLNEASEISKEVFDMAFGRIGRFPNKRDGGHTWCGLFMDTNAPDDDHWYYEMAEKPDQAMLDDLRKVLREISGEDRPLLGFFRQPAALLWNPLRETYEENPKAENICNLTEGFGYYFRQILKKNKNWINVYILANYGTVGTGKPVYPEFNDQIHVSSKTLDLVDGIPLLMGQDFGLSPACALSQVTPRGQFLTLGEITTPEHGDIGIRRFLGDYAKPYLINRFGSDIIKQIIMYGDPAGVAKAQTDEKSCFEEAKAAGFNAQPAKTNAWIPRRESVAYFLSRLVDGYPGYLLDPSASMLRKGFNGRYFYERVQNSGEEARYHDQACKNKYSHVHDGQQYSALSVGMAAMVAAKLDMRPKWEREYMRQHRRGGFMGR